MSFSEGSSSSASLRKVLALSWESGDGLPCREKEIAAISTFLKEAVGKKSPGAIYLSGVPGTGKTASVEFALRSLEVSLSS